MNRLFIALLVFLFLSACRQNNKASVIEASATERVVSSKEINQDSILAKAKKEKGLKHTPLDYDTLQWTELIRMDSSFVVDLKYATTDNFVKEKMYECARCFLRPVAAKILYKVHKEFKKQGLRIKLLDCYRPASVQQRLWEKVPNASYVTPPSKGSMHNRGLAVDLTLVDKDGKELDMGTPYDFFGRKAHHTHTKLPQEVLANRRLLKSTMEAAGFKSIRTEWWHYSYRSGKFGIVDMEWPCNY